ncbi:MAG: NAD(P)-dependent oxidoreductase [Micromonosporaceae bacterium]|nr:NAD(P)-dependent oxidoreductase [Micromonosporaceae bacterium]
MTPTAVVLGGTGFLGRHVCAALRRHAYRVVAVGRTARVVPGCPVWTLDAAADPGRLANLLAGQEPSVVVNAAGAVWGRDGEGRALVDGNVTTVANLIAAATVQRRPPRLVHLGSVYEYGQQPPGVRIYEQTPACPCGGYPQSKLRGTELVLAAPPTLRPLVLRLSTVVGPGAPEQSLFGGILKQLAAAGPPGPVPLRLPALRGCRDFIDVRDVSDAVVRACRSTATGVLNVASGVPYPVAAAVDALIETTGLPVLRLAAPAGTRGSPVRRDAGIGTQLISVGAARARLGWRPHYSLTQALEHLWRHQQITSRTSAVAVTAEGSRR